MVFAGRFDTGDVEDDLFRGVVAVLRKAALIDAVIVQHDLSPRDLPVFHKVVRCTLADGGYHIGNAPDAVRQDMADVEHAEDVVFRRNVILGEVVYHSISLAGFPQQHAPVGRSDDKTVPPPLREPPWEQEKTVEHAEQRPGGPGGQDDMFESGELRHAGCGRLQDQRQFMPPCGKLADDVADTDGDPGFPGVVWNAKQEDFHFAPRIKSCQPFSRPASVNRTETSSRPHSPMA